MSGAEPRLLAAVAARERLDYRGDPPDAALAERLLEVPTRIVLGARDRNPALAALDLDGALARAEHSWPRYRDATIHLEHHAVPEPAATVVVVHGLGDHSRRQLPLAAALAERGFASLLVDRHGHGLSEGRRGDATLESDLGVVEMAIGLARASSEAPVVLLGDSLGGILSWYLLTREPDIEAAVCHCIGHPDVHPDPSFRWKQPLIRALGGVAPYAPVPVSQIADYSQVALDPETRRYFEQRVDPLFNFSVTLRSAASYLRFEPAIPWEGVETPALVMIGGADGMVTPAFTRESLDRARPPRADYLEVPGAGHQLFLDDLGLAIDPLVGWIRTAVEPRVATAP